jgi:regulator of replication initiation timing
MNYTGKLYGKFAGKYVPLTMTTEDVGILERENETLEIRHAAVMLHTQSVVDENARLRKENARLQMELDTSERELKERGVDIQELATALQIEREGKADRLDRPVLILPNVASEPSRSDSRTK